MGAPLSPAPLPAGALHSMLGAMDKRVSEEVRAPEQPLEIPKGFFFFPPGGQQPRADSPQDSAVARVLHQCMPLRAFWVQNSAFGLWELLFGVLGGP